MIIENKVVKVFIKLLYLIWMNSETGFPVHFLYIAYSYELVHAHLHPASLWPNNGV